MKIVLKILKENNNKKKIKAILYGKNIENLKTETEKKNIYYEKLKKNEKVNLKIINKKYKSIIKEIKYHPYKKEIIHIDFYIYERI